MYFLFQTSMEEASEISDSTIEHTWNIPWVAEFSFRR